MQHPRQLADALALLVVPLVLMLYVVQARANVEAGLFFFAAQWQPVAVLLGLLGLRALGPVAVVGLGLLCLMLTIDTRETLMPFVVNALRITEDAQVRPSRVGWIGIPLFAAGLAVAVPIVLHANYNSGLPKWDTFYLDEMARRVPDAGEQAIRKLTEGGHLEASVNLTPIQRITQMRPDPQFLWADGIGLVLVLVFSALRLRFPRWPLHPIIFLVGGSIPVCRFAPCIFLGWAAKTIVMKMGGMGFYHKVKPLMVGIIAGDMVGAILFMIHGFVYYAITGMAPKGYWVFPR